MAQIWTSLIVYTASLRLASLLDMSSAFARARLRVLARRLALLQIETRKRREGRGQGRTGGGGGLTLDPKRPSYDRRLDRYFWIDMICPSGRHFTT